MVKERWGQKKERMGSENGVRSRIERMGSRERMGSGLAL
jgi:hypothetical protein